MALLPLVEMDTVPPIAPGYDMLRPMNRFNRRHAELDNCSCPIAEHSRAKALIELSCACKRTESFSKKLKQTLGPILHPAQLTFYTDACIVASLHPAQS